MNTLDNKVGGLRTLPFYWHFPEKHLLKKHGGDHCMHNPRIIMDISRVDSSPSLGRNVIICQAFHFRSIPGYYQFPGPLFFLRYINDMSNCVNFIEMTQFNSLTIILFADGCLNYTEIRSQQETEHHQADLTALQTYGSDEFLLSAEMSLLRVTIKTFPIIAQYNIHEHVL